MRIVKRLYDAGVTIVPGTDNAFGLPLQGELEIYERAGIPASAVLQIATIVPARVMKQDKDYGSITVGKVADLVIIAGKPTERIGDVRRTVAVVRGGRLYKTKDLFAGRTWYSTSLWTHRPGTTPTFPFAAERALAVTAGSPADTRRLDPW